MIEEPLRHIASLAKAARRDLKLSQAGAIARVIETLEEIETSARRALATSLENEGTP